MRSEDLNGHVFFFVFLRHKMLDLFSYGISFVLLHVFSEQK